MARRFDGQEADIEQIENQSILLRSSNSTTALIRKLGDLYYISRTSLLRQRLSTFLHNPYLFCKCWLWHETEHRPATAVDSSGVAINSGDLLIGQTVSSLHRLKDLDNSGMGPYSPNPSRFTTDLLICLAS